MTNTYDPTTLSADTAEGRRNRVRFELADTDTTEGLYVFDDDEVDYLLAQNSDIVLLAAAAGAGRLAMTYARKADEQELGPLRVEYGDRSEQFAMLARQLTARAQTEGEGFAAVPWAGGIVRVAGQDSGMVQPRFFRGQFDNDDGPHGDNALRPGGGLE